MIPLFRHLCRSDDSFLEITEDEKCSWHFTDPFGIRPFNHQFEEEEVEECIPTKCDPCCRAKGGDCPKVDSLTEVPGVAGAELKPDDVHAAIQEKLSLTPEDLKRCYRARNLTLDLHTEDLQFKQDNKVDQLADYYAELAKLIKVIIPDPTDFTDFPDPTDQEALLKKREDLRKDLLEKLKTFPTKTTHTRNRLYFVVGPYEIVQDLSFSSIDGSNVKASWRGCSRELSVPLETTVQPGDNFRSGIVRPTSFEEKPFMAAFKHNLNHLVFKPRSCETECGAEPDALMSPAIQDAEVYAFFKESFGRNRFPEFAIEEDEAPVEEAVTED